MTRHAPISSGIKWIAYHFTPPPRPTSQTKPQHSSASLPFSHPSYVIETSSPSDQPLILVALLHFSTRRVNGLYILSEGHSHQHDVSSTRKKKSKRKSKAIVYTSSGTFSWWINWREVECTNSGCSSSFVSPASNNIHCCKGADTRSSLLTFHPFNTLSHMQLVSFFHPFGTLITMVRLVVPYSESCHIPSCFIRRISELSWKNISAKSCTTM